MGRRRRWRKDQNKRWSMRRKENMQIQRGSGGSYGEKSEEEMRDRCNKRGEVNEAWKNGTRRKRE